MSCIFLFISTLFLIFVSLHHSHMKICYIELQFLGKLVITSQLHVLEVIINIDDFQRPILTPVRLQSPGSRKALLHLDHF